MHIGCVHMRLFCSSRDAGPEFPRTFAHVHKYQVSAHITEEIIVRDIFPDVTPETDQRESEEKRHG